MVFTLAACSKPLPAKVQSLLLKLSMDFLEAERSIISPQNDRPFDAISVTKARDMLYPIDASRRVSPLHFTGAFKQYVAHRS